MRSGVAVAQPTFHPVNENVLPAEPIETTRPRMPSMVASGYVLAVEREVLVGLVGDHEEVVVDGDPRDRLGLRAGEHHAGGVVRAVEHEQPGLAR